MAIATDWSNAGDAGRRLGRTVEFHASIGSTNDRAWERLRQGDEGSAVVADLQTAGRGRHGRTWSSPAGVNVNWPRTEMPSEIAGRATSLMDLGGGAVDRVALLRSYLIGLAGEVAGLEAGISPLERYRAASWLNGRDARISVGERVVAGRV